MARTLYARSKVIITYLILGLISSINLHAQFVTNGTAVSIGSDCYRLTQATATQAGSIFSTTTINLGSAFSISGTFNFGNIDGNGADGITFLFSTSNTSLGSGGGGIAYQGITPSVVVEFDTWLNGGNNNDPPSDHFGIQQNGNPNHGSADNLAGPIQLPNLEDGQEHCFSVNWDPITLTLTAFIDGNMISYTGSIAAIMGTSNVYYGFTASTGAAFNEHVVCLSTPDITPMEDIEICQFESVQLQADPSGTTYSWNFDPTLSAFNISNPVATPFTTTTYIVEIGFDCGETVTDDVIVTVLPGPNATATNSGIACEGDDITLMATGGGTYSWSGPDGFTSNEQNPTLTNVDDSVSDMYTVTVTAPNGCTSTAQTFVVVLPPTPAFIQPLLEPLCAGSDPVQMVGFPDGGTWGGVADSDGWVNPADLGGGTFSVTYMVDDPNGCPGMDELMIDIGFEPIIDIIPPPPACIGDDVELNASGGDTYSWSGPNGFVSDESNPTLFDVQLEDAGTYSVTVTDAAGCSAEETVQVVVFPNPTVTITPIFDPICQDAPSFQMFADPFGGIWGGVADINGFVDPSGLIPGTYTVTYFYTDFSGCSGEDETEITIVGAPEVIITPTGPLCDTDASQILSANPPGGNWSGSVDADGTFHPQDLGEGTWEVNYDYIDANGCEGSDMIFIDVQPGTVVDITPAGPFCEDDNVQTLFAFPLGGTWGGVASSNGQITPTDLDPGLHMVTYTLDGQGSCPGEDTIFVEIWADPIGVISGTGTICTGSGDEVDVFIDLQGNEPFEVIIAINNVDQDPITLSNGVNTLPVQEGGSYEIISIVDVNGCVGSGSGTAEVVVVDAPQVSNFEIICDPTQTSYTVTFEISEGDSLSYIVSGANTGILSNTSPFIFTSDPIPSGDNYEFIVDDVNNCNPTTLSGSFSCLCLSDAGSMDNNMISVCEGDQITATHLGDSTLDANDHFLFFLHDANGNTLGNIFDSGTEPTFELVPPMETNTIYYISAVAGNSDGNGGINLNDPCLSVSFGTPVFWQELPNGSVSQDTSICNGTEVEVIFNLSGNAPFDISYSVGGDTLNLENIFDGHTINLSPAATTEIHLISINDNSDPLCISMVNSSITITVNNHVTTPLNEEICAGETIFLGGELQSESGTYFDTLSTIFGCDSVLITELIVNPLDTTYIEDTDCNPNNVGTFVSTLQNQNNCDSVVILTVLFSDSDTSNISTPTCNPGDVGVFTNTFVTPEGCDSVVIESVFLLPSDTTMLEDSSCNPNEIGVFTTNLINQWGCDSTVILTVSFFQIDTTFFEYTTCNPNEEGVITTDFVTPDGCDSVVVENYILLPSDSTFLTDESCNPNEVGVFVENLMNQYGCDSTVILTVDFFALDTTFLFNSTCNPGEVGVFTSTIITNDGCDSIIVEDIVLEPLDTTFIFDSTCDPLEAGIFASNLVTSEGCDSIVVETITLNPSDTTYTSDTTCDPLEEGVFTTISINQFGCDSTNIETVTLLPSDTVMVDQTSCEPQDTGTVLLNLINQFGCDSLVIVNTTLLPPEDCGVEAGILGSLIGCDENSGFLTLIVSLGQAPFDYTWSGPSSGMGTINSINQDEVIDNLPAGTYTVEITASNGFMIELSAEIEQIFSPEVSLEVLSGANGYDLSCANTSDGSITSTIVSGQAPYQYFWSTGDDEESITDLNAGTYALTVIDDNNCEDSAEVTLIAPEPLEMGFVVSDINCFGQNAGEIVAEVTGGVAPYQYSINGGDFQSNNTFGGLVAGTYDIVVQDANQCAIEEVVWINAPIPVDVELGDNIQIELGDEVTLNALINIPISELENVSWSGLDTVACENCLTQAVAPIITSTYSISVQAENGCEDEDQITLIVDRQKEIFVPNIFSANEDGTNDKLMIFSKDNVVLKIRSFLVFNRWGETVFEYYNFDPNNPDFGWDGTHRGKVMNPAVFVWFADVEFIDGTTKIFKGDAALVR